MITIHYYISIKMPEVKISVIASTSVMLSRQGKQNLFQVFK